MITLEEFGELLPGVRVVLRSDLENGKCYGNTYCCNYMEHNMRGQIVTIVAKRYDRQTFTIKEDSFNRCTYNYEMIDHIYDGSHEADGAIEVDIYDNSTQCRHTADEYILVRVSEDKDFVRAHGNSEKFVDIVAGKWVLVNKGNNRIENELNPHISAELEAAGIRNWKLDNWDSCSCLSSYTDPNSISICRVRMYGIFKINFANGYCQRKLMKGEVMCPHCGTPVKKALLIGKYCKNCLKNMNITTRFGYHNYDKGYPTPEGVDTHNTLVFGCEIERDYDSGLTDNDLNDNLQMAMEDIIKVFHKKELQKGTLKRNHVFMSDGSLHCNGLEWITFPHTFKWYVKHKTEFDEAIQKIKKYGFTDTLSAGNHIHMNRDFFGDDAEFNAAKISVLFNTYWKEFTSIARRDINRCSYTSKPSQTKNDSIFNVVSKTIDNRSEHGVAVNLQHSKTVEIRLWSAIRNADDLIFFLDNMQALARYVKHASLEKIQKADFTDYMKYYKLKSSYDLVLENLHENHITKYDNKINNLIHKGDN